MYCLFSKVIILVDSAKTMLAMCADTHYGNGGGLSEHINPTKSMNARRPAQDLLNIKVHTWTTFVIWYEISRESHVGRVAAAV